MQIDKFFEKIYIINLKRSCDRRSHIVKQFKELGIDNYELLEGVDGSLINSADPAWAGILDFQNFWKASVNALACALSHVKLYEHVLAKTSYERILICEDDIVFCEDLNSRFEQIQKSICVDWDILHLHSHFPLHDPKQSRNRYRRRLNDHLHLGFNEGGGAMCYAVNRKCMKYLIDNAYPIDKSADGLTNWPSLPEFNEKTGLWDARGSLQAFVLWPFICEHNHFPSTIGYEKI